MYRFLIFNVLVLAATPSANAALQLRSIARSQTSGTALGTHTDYENIDTGLITVNPGDSQHVEAHTSSSVSGAYPAHASGNAWITTQPGEFHASLDAAASSSGSYAAVYAYTYGEWHDSLTISSSTLPNGTLVGIVVTVVVDHTVTDGGVTSPWNVQVTSSFVSQYSNSSTSPNPSDMVTGTLFATVGSTLNIWQTLNANAPTQTVAGAVSGYPSSDSIAMDIAHTAYTYFTPPDGVTLTSTSGATYRPALSAAVPEPTAFAMWALGTLGLAIGTHRRRRRMAAGRATNHG
jgi:hypothetical protein